jgi:hypothetical protein
MAVKWIPYQASHGFLAWAENLRNDKIFGMETDAKNGPGRGNWVYIGP